MSSDAAPHPQIQHRFSEATLNALEQNHLTLSHTGSWQSTDEHNTNKEGGEEPPPPPAVQAVQPSGIDVVANGVKQSIYAKWIKLQLESETACLELPFTIVLLLAFAFLALAHLGQAQVIKVEDSIMTDIMENTNFAYAHAFGHKGIQDVNSFADFWSWGRIGLFAILPTPGSWPYSENLDSAVPEPAPGSNVSLYDASLLPSHLDMGPTHLYKTPIRNDYLRYNRMVGGFRFRQQVAAWDGSMFGGCFRVGSKETFDPAYGKQCTGRIGAELPPDNFETESFDDPQRVEWFLSESESHKTMLQHIVDMEDGCSSAQNQNRTCLCTWCATQPDITPWLNESTQRIEIAWITYNPQYGMYNMAVVNFWFNRAGQIHKLANVRSAWAGLLTRPMEDLISMCVADFIWVFSIMYVCKSEGSEIHELIKSNVGKPWYLTLIDDYLSFWNLVDWSSICIAFMIIICFLVLYVCTIIVNYEFGEVALAAMDGGFPLPDRLSKVEQFFTTAEAMFRAEKDFRFWLSIYPLVLMLRLFKSFAAQPRLAVVTETFRVAHDDLMHFFIVFFSVYFCFSVNAVLFFGQDSVNFSTLYRALHSSFRIMLGDWDYDELVEIGQMKAFLWFSTFMLVMVLILMNMLLAILMDAYYQVSEAAGNAESVPHQMRETFRRNRQFKKGLRVRLNDIYDALLDVEGNNETKLLASERVIYPDWLQSVVPHIPKSQARRTLENAQKAYNKENDPVFGAQDLLDPLMRTETRVEYSAQCAAWLNTRFTDYKRFEDERLGTTAEERENGQSEVRPGPNQESLVKEGIAAVTLVAQERTQALSDGVSAVLAEEMQGLERRQKDQQKSMDQMQSGLQALRQLVYKLNQTCSDIGDLSSQMNEQPARPRPQFDQIPAQGTDSLAISNGGPDATDALYKSLK